MSPRRRRRRCRQSPPPPLTLPCPPSPCPAARLLYWLAAEGASRSEAHDALADSIACLGPSASTRCTAQVATLRRVQQRGADELQSVQAAEAEGGPLHRVALSDEQDQLFLLSRWGRRQQQNHDCWGRC